MKVTVLVGNPKAASRTLELALAVADAVAPIVQETQRTVIDLAEVSGRVFDWADETVSALNRELAQSDLAIVASPTYKAAYTGLLKAFLDRYDTNGLAGLVAAPVMSGGSPAHSLAPDFTLRPLLVELGASTPTRSLYCMTSQMGDLPAVIGPWVEANRRALEGVAVAARGG